MNYLEKNRGIYNAGLKRIARELKMPVSKKAQEGNKVERRKELLDFIAEYLEPEEFIQQLMSALPDDILIQAMEGIIQMSELGYELPADADPDSGFVWGEPVEGHPLG